MFLGRTDPAPNIEFLPILQLWLQFPIMKQTNKINPAGKQIQPMHSFYLNHNV